MRFFLFAVAWSSGSELELFDSNLTMPCQDELDEDASTARSGTSLVHDIIDRGGFPTWISLVENAVQGSVKLIINEYKWALMKHYGHFGHRGCPATIYDLIISGSWQAILRILLNFSTIKGKRCLIRFEISWDFIRFHKISVDFTFNTTRVCLFWKEIPTTFSA